MKKLLLAVTKKSVTTFGAGFNLNEFKNTITPYTKPVIDALLWLLPAAFVIFVLSIMVQYYISSETKREEIQVANKVRTGLYILLVGEGLIIFLKVFGIAV